MGTPLKMAVAEQLTMGRDSAAQLRTLLRDHHGPVAAQELAVRILRSLEGALSAVAATPSSSDSGELVQISAAAQAESPTADHRIRPAVKERRGGCKRRKTSDSQVQISSTMEDGYAWRKYGQKDILNAKFPRCYYRCTHKPDQGCLATKQVQAIAEGPLMFETTYFGHHTCRNKSINPSNFAFHSHSPMYPSETIFEPRNSSTTVDARDPISIKNSDRSIGEDIKEEAPSNPIDDTGAIFWSDDPMAGNEDVVSGFSSSSSTSYFVDFDMESIMEYVNFGYCNFN